MMLNLMVLLGDKELSMVPEKLFGFASHLKPGVIQKSQDGTTPSDVFIIYTSGMFNNVDQHLLSVQAGYGWPFIRTENFFCDFSELKKPIVVYFFTGQAVHVCTETIVTKLPYDSYIGFYPISDTTERHIQTLMTMMQEDTCTHPEMLSKMADLSLGSVAHHHPERGFELIRPCYDIETLNNHDIAFSA